VLFAGMPSVYAFQAESVDEAVNFRDEANEAQALGLNQVVNDQICSSARAAGLVAPQEALDIEKQPGIVEPPLPSGPLPDLPDNLVDMRPPCEGETRIQIINRQQLDNVFLDYVTHINQRNELCLEFPCGPILIDSAVAFPVVQNPPAVVKIVGLSMRPVSNFTQSEYAVRIVNAQNRVILAEMDLEGFRHNVYVENSNVGIDKSTMICSGKGKGIHLENTNGAIIRANEISRCEFGLVSSNSSGGRFGADRLALFNFHHNAFSNNGTGINIIGSTGDKFEYNLVNKTGGVGAPIEETYLEGIEIDAHADRSSHTPVFTPVKGRDEGGTRVHCAQDQAERILRRRVRVDEKFKGGSLTLYRISHMTREMYYFGTCNVDEDGFCDVIDHAEFGNHCWCIGDGRMTALYTKDSTSEFMDPILCDPLETTVFFQDTEAVVIVTAPESAAGGESAPEGGAGAEKAGGCIGGKSSLIPHDMHRTGASSLAFWWIILAVTLMASLRLARVRHNRRK